jgi:hypothetical protein
LQTICPSWLQTTILLISASLVARITGMSHQCPAILHLIICICWTIPASLGWSRFGHGEWSFWYAVGFSLPLFYWGFLHQC